MITKSVEAQECSDDWKLVGDKCYNSFNSDGDSFTWDAAQAQCAKNGATLPVPKTKNDIDGFLNFVYAQCIGVFIFRLCNCSNF